MNSFFLQGLQHPLLTSAHLIILIALGIFFGQQNAKERTSALISFVLFTLVGLVTTRLYQAEWNLEIVLLILAGLMGIVIALKCTLPLWSVIIFSLLAGFVIGLDSAPIMIPGLSTRKVYSNMAGTLTSASLILLFVSLVAALMNKFWQGIVLRILGAWVFASTIMVVALAFSPMKANLGNTNNLNTTNGHLIS